MYHQISFFLNLVNSNRSRLLLRKYLQFDSNSNISSDEEKSEESAVCEEEESESSEVCEEEESEGSEVCEEEHIPQLIIS